jgi:hypothetical protein
MPAQRSPWLIAAIVAGAAMLGSLGCCIFICAGSAIHPESGAEKVARQMAAQEREQERQKEEERRAARKVEAEEQRKALQKESDAFRAKAAEEAEQRRIDREIKQRQAKEKAKEQAEREAKAKAEMDTIPPMPRDIAQIISRFGRPTQDYSNEKNETRPKTFLRWLVYKPERVRIVFVRADDELWNLKEFVTDDATRTPLTESQALKMLEKRDARALALAERKRVAAQKAIDDAKYKGVTRAGYNAITRGMEYKEVAKILGPGREILRVQYLVTFRWEGSGVVIVIVFDGGQVDSKAIND